ncbi:MAG TPA: type II CAAX endopeptidase family protein [Candidatus Sulfotelmatobacter sp.]|nr:type II CAAX endopeptidase family protein [Candidatus Sulfotelmatobacter sp.]
MTIVPDEPAASSTPEAAAVAPPSGWRLMGRAVVWSLLSYVGALAVSFFFGVVLGVTGLHGRIAETDRPMLYAVFGVIGTATILTWVALYHAASAGQGDWRVGIGDRAIARPWAIAVIALVISAYAALITFGALNASPQALRRAAGVNPILIAIGLALAVVVAPLAEELFFRGWLWTGLRTRWGAVASGAVTSTLWLVLHLPDGVGRMTLLVPAAIALPLARHYGRSVRASIVVHACNNATAGATPLVALWLGWLAWP